jgi:hypothetical protein
MVSGESHGEVVTQITPCDVWADDGGVVFWNLKPNVPVTLRASQDSGYIAREVTVLPGGGMAIRIELSGIWD